MEINSSELQEVKKAYLFLFLQSYNYKGVEHFNQVEKVIYFQHKIFAIIIEYICI